MGARKVEDYWLLIANEQEAIDSAYNYIEKQNLIGRSVRNQLLDLLERVKNRVLQHLEKLPVNGINEQLNQLHQHCLIEINQLIEIETVFPIKLELVSDFRNDLLEQKVKANISTEEIQATYSKLTNKLSNLQRYCAIDAKLEVLSQKYLSRTEKLIRLRSHVRGDKNELAKLRDKEPNEKTSVIEALTKRIEVDETKIENLEQSLKNIPDEVKNSLLQIMNSEGSKFKAVDVVVSELVQNTERMESVEFVARVCKKVDGEELEKTPKVASRRRIRNFSLLGIFLIASYFTSQVFITTKNKWGEQNLKDTGVVETIEVISQHPFFKRYLKEDDFLRIAQSSTEGELREAVKISLKRNADGAKVSREIQSLFHGWGNIPIKMGLEPFGRFAHFSHREETVNEFREKFGDDSHIYLQASLSTVEVEKMSLSKDRKTTILPFDIVCSSKGGLSAIAKVNLPLEMSFEVKLDYPFAKFHAQLLKTQGHCN